jgi:hypothetical protein
MSPPRKMRRREPKLQRLPEKASARAHQVEEAPGDILTATAGQVDRSYRRAVGKAVAALEEKTELHACKPARSPFPSPPRLTERGEEGGADTTSGLPAPRTRADEELRLPPDPFDARFLPQLPSPPRPDGERRGKTGQRELENSRRWGSY